MPIHQYGPPVKRKSDGQLYRLTPTQQRQAVRLIKANCCNYDGGNCLLLDCVCPQTISHSVLCRWFCNAVLPLNPELEAMVFKDHRLRKCSVCGAGFLPRSNRQKYCDTCSKVQARKADSARKRKKRVAMSTFRG